MAIKFGRPLESRTRFVPVVPVDASHNRLDLRFVHAAIAARTGLGGWCGKAC
jgi:hypothetical protein